ncbi:APC amino acid permease [Mycena olivaceomarginata]|nr:APC amino acid permease [Mycena olivaceomarginata]
MASIHSSVDDDDKELLALGYVPSFKREFSNLATISFAFSIMGLCSSIATTFGTPLTLGGPSVVVWAWILGACMCFTLGSSIAEIVSAFPTCGGLYTASAQLTPLKYRAIVGWVVGWLNILGQIAGVSSTEFGLSGMILAADFVVTPGKTVGLFAELRLDEISARFTQYFVFVNLGATALIIITLLATTPRSEMHPASYVFGTAGLVNATGGWNTGLAFLFGLLSVQWTMTDYDATAHVSEEVKRAAYADALRIAPSAMLQIMNLRMGKTGALILWVFVCLTAFFVVQTALQAVSRTVFAFSRDHGLPDGGYFGYNSQWTHTPLRAIWLSTIFSILPGLLDLASPAAANAIFSLTAIALDLSYIIPIFLRRVFENHPDVKFKPGPFYMGPGVLGWAANIACISWTLFVCVIFSFPTLKPVTALNMNYASSGVWYFLHAHKHYKGPTSNVREGKAPSQSSEDENRGEKGEKGDMA